MLPNTFVCFFQVKETLFYDERIKTKSKEKHLLEDTISAMLLSFCCVVVVGGEKYTEDVNKVRNELVNYFLLFSCSLPACFHKPTLFFLITLNFIFHNENICTCNTLYLKLTHYVCLAVFIF